MRNKTLLAGTLFLLNSCTTLPLAPSIAVMPAPGKPFDLFVDEEALCRRFAATQAGASSQQAVTESAVTQAAVGTAVGAAAGTAIGAATGHVGEGAIVGAGTGLFAGSISGMGGSNVVMSELQRRYDIAYEQCMYAKGNQVPGFISTPYAAPSLPPPPPPSS